MRIPVTLLAVVLVAGFGVDAKADSRGHGGHSRSYSGSHYGGHSGWGGGGYGHGYRGGYYNGYRGGYYGGSSVYFSTPIVVSRPVYYSRPVYQGRTVAYRSNSLEVNVQVALRKRGYYSGPIDGDIGPGTQAAIRAYQRDNELRATGTISNSLLARLGL